MGQGPKDGHHSGAFEKRKDRQGAFLDIFDIFKHVSYRTSAILQRYFSGQVWIFAVSSISETFEDVFLMSLQSLLEPDNGTDNGLWCYHVLPRLSAVSVFDSGTSRRALLAMLRLLSLAAFVTASNAQLLQVDGSGTTMPGAWLFSSLVESVAAALRWLIRTNIETLTI